MIVAHHGGEAGLVTALAASAGTVPLLLAVGRARLGELLDRLWRRT